MTLLWVDGLEMYGASGGAVNPSTGFKQKYYGYYENRIDVDTSRTGSGNCIRFDSSSTRITTPPLTTNRTLIVGVAFKTTDVNTEDILFSFRHPYTGGYTVGYNCLEVMLDSGEIKILRANTQLGSTSNLALTANTWRYLEVKVYCDDTNGTYEVKVDGTSVLTGTGDTKYSSYWNYYSTIMFRRKTSNHLWIDDLYICDGAGSDNNDFLGDCKVLEVLPNGDASGNWTAQGGGSRYVEVDEAVLDNDTTYISSDTTGEQAVFDYAGANIGSGSVKGVMLSTYAKFSGMTEKHIKHLTQNGTGNIVDGTAQLCQEEYMAVTEVFEEDADDASWTQSTINSARFGVETV